MDLIHNYDTDDDDTLLTVAVGGDDLEKTLSRHQMLARVGLHRDKRWVKTELAEVVVDDNDKDEFVFNVKRGARVIKNRRNRFSDDICLTEAGRQKEAAVKAGVDQDIELVRWILYCPGTGNCQRSCGGFGTCAEGCTKRRGRHDKHNCSVKVVAKVLISQPKEWKVKVEGRHVPPGVEWRPSEKNLKISEQVKDRVMKTRIFGLRHFDVYRRELAGIPEQNMKDAFQDTRQHPMPNRLIDFVKNTEKRHGFQSGQWTAVHAAIPHIKNKGNLLFYQESNDAAEVRDIDKCYVLTLSNQTALASARRNQHVLGLDGKHGLQDDGACLMTSVTQHKDGFGCPSAFSIVNRENTDSIYLTLRAIVENVPCDRENCQHPFNYFRLPGNLGYRRNTQCAAVVPYKPMVMIDKHEPSANACQRLDLQHILCWFHIVKALMEKLKTLNLCLVTSYIIVLGFKIVARSLDRASANQRWILFLEMIDLMGIPAVTKIALRKYFVDEWWCDKWRMAWLDVSRLPLIEGGQRTMTTNNHDENLNLQVADCIGSRRKKISTLVTELTGIQAAKENNAATSVVEPKKASLLDTHAAKTIAHDLGKKNSTPADIRLRDNKARLQFLSGGISVVDGTNNSYLYVKDTSSSLKRFRDHKGNWVTVTAEASSVLEGMMTTLMPPSCEHVPKDCVIVNVDNVTCTCTDHLWRSSLRDPCHHFKAARMYKRALLMGITAVQEEEKRLLTRNIKQQQLAKPIDGRNLLLCSDDNEIVVSEMQRLHSIHGNKMWEILSTVKKTKVVDRHRPLDLPRDKVVQGKPKQRNAKPRPANPFKRRRKLVSQGAVTIQKPRGDRHSSYSIKRGRNAARRASNKIVSRARQQVLHKLCTPKAVDTRDVHSTPGIGHNVEPTPGCSKDMNRTPVTRKTDLVYSRLMTKRLEIESQKRQATPYQMQLLRFKSPGLSRGQLLVKLSKLKNKPTFSRSGRLIKKKTKGCDFVTP